MNTISGTQTSRATLDASGNFSATGTVTGTNLPTKIVYGKSSATNSNGSSSAPIYWSSAVTVTTNHGFTPSAVFTNPTANGFLQWANVSAYTTTSITYLISRVGAYPSTTQEVSYAIFQ
jgi:hypothetical protein